MLAALGAAHCKTQRGEVPQAGSSSAQAPLVDDSNDRPVARDRQVTSAERERLREARIDALLQDLTVSEKIAQLGHDAPAVERVGLPPYGWWNEALHGVARTGRATVFPQAIALGATFDPELIESIGEAIASEARAKYGAARALGRHDRYSGLTFWSPNVNIFRDPRWGRGHETYGEDPFLTARLGVAFVRGLQGPDPENLRVAACAKHFAVHSGPEALRHGFDVSPSRKDLEETYLPAFEALVREAGVECVMAAYNRVYGEPASGSQLLLREILRERWQFEGHVVSDCWALGDFHTSHGVTDTPAESAAMALHAGVDLNCGVVYQEALGDALEQDLVDEKDIDRALRRLLRTRLRLGLLEPKEASDARKRELASRSAHSQAAPSLGIETPAHRLLARQAAARSIVLLENDGVLPLDPQGRRYVLLGPFAADANVLYGNYHGLAAEMVTVAEGMAAAVSPGTRLEYRYGFLPFNESKSERHYSVLEARGADAIVVTAGNSPLIEGEEGESIASEAGGDRRTIGLPTAQLDYLRVLRQHTEAPIVVVLFGGSAIAAPELRELADAVLMAWYPGQGGGSAVADILFGHVNPSGRLPVTFPRSVRDLPPYEDYSMKGRTYRYAEAPPLYPFGYGASYTTFHYEALQVSRKELDPGQDLEVSVRVTNAGIRAGSEVVQVYLTDREASVVTPQASLVAFQRVALERGEQKRVALRVPGRAFVIIDEGGQARYESGDFDVIVAAHAPAGGEWATDRNFPRVSTSVTLR